MENFVGNACFLNYQEYTKNYLSLHWCKYILKHLTAQNLSSE